MVATRDIEEGASDPASQLAVSFPPFLRITHVSDPLKSLTHQEPRSLFPQESSCCRRHRWRRWCFETPTRRAATRACGACRERRSDETLRCQGCRIERYCSSTCMNTARLTHHSPAGECAAFEAAMDAECSGGPAFAFDDLPNRFLVRVVSQAGGWRVPGEPAQRGALIHRFLTLEASVPEEGTVERRLLASIARNTLRLMDESVNEGVKTVDPDASAEGTSLRLGESELTRVMCCVHRNSHALYAHVGSDGAEAGSVGVESRPVGAAVYLEGSAFNHRVAREQPSARGGERASRHL